MREENVPGTDIKKPKVQLTGRDGNAFAIMGAVCKALKRAKVPADIVQKYTNESTSGDYNNLLATAVKYADVR